MHAHAIHASAIVEAFPKGPLKNFSAITSPVCAGPSIFRCLLAPSIDTTESELCKLITKLSLILSIALSGA